MRTPTTNRFTAIVCVSRIDQKTGARVVIYRDVPAERRDRLPQSMAWHLKATKLLSGIEAGDWITDADGATWEVTQAARGGNATIPFWHCEVVTPG